jgi:hypothetical protein
MGLPDTATASPPSAKTHNTTAQRKVTKGKNKALDSLRSAQLQQALQQQQQALQQQQPLAAVVCSPMPARFTDAAPSVKTEFERDDADREMVFHAMLQRLVALFTNGNLVLEREAADRWTILSSNARPLFLEFTLRHERLQLLTHPVVTWGTKSSYDVELLLPGPSGKVCGIVLTPKGNTARALAALRELAPSIFR